MDGSLLSAEQINSFFVHNPIFIISISISAFIGTLIYLFGFSDVIRKELKRRRMKHRIDSLKDHYIICGFGRVGQQVARELANEGEPFVVIDKEDDRFKLAKEHNWAFLVGDIAVDETLFQKAQIQAAKGIIIAVGTDADAIFMAISARALNQNIFIVARASSVEAADKLTKVGVNRTALPYQIGGYHMATMATRPSVVDFLDTLVDPERRDLEMEEYSVQEGGFYDGKTVKDADFVKDGLAILAIRRKDGKALINPDETTQLKAGDRIVMMGSEAKLLEVTKEVDKHQDSKKEEQQSQKVMAQDIKPTPFAKEGE